MLSDAILDFVLVFWSFSYFSDLNDTQGKVKHYGDWSHKYNKSWWEDLAELDEKIKSTKDFITTL